MSTLSSLRVYCSPLAYLGGRLVLKVNEAPLGDPFATYDKPSNSILLSTFY
jgi:hypothetical protein